MLVGAAVGVVGSCQLPQLAASSLLRATAPAALLALRGGASVGPIKCGPISIDLLLGPRGCAASPARSGTTSPGPSPDPRPCQGAVRASAAAGPAHTLSHSPSLAPQPPPLFLRPLLRPEPVPQPLRPVPLPHVRCVVLNAVAGLLYSMSLIGLDPNMPDPTLK